MIQNKFQNKTKSILNHAARKKMGKGLFFINKWNVLHHFQTKINSRFGTVSRGNFCAFENFAPFQFFFFQIFGSICVKTKREIFSLWKIVSFPDLLPLMMSLSPLAELPISVWQKSSHRINFSEDYTFPTVFPTIKKWQKQFVKKN